jgi:hypothetical protein
MLKPYNKLMLTDTEQKKRAQQISQLYNAPLKRQAAKPVVYQAKWAVLAGVVLTVPAIYLYFILFFFNNINYTNIADVQAAGMVFIVQFLGWGVLVIFCLKYFRDVIYNHFTSLGITFWLSFLFLSTFYIYLMQVIPGVSLQTPDHMLLRAGLFFALSAGASVALLIFITYLVHKLTSKQS